MRAGTSKDDVIKTFKQFSKKLAEDKLFPVLQKATKGLNFYNTSYYDLQRLSQDAESIELNFNDYLSGYSKNVYEIIENLQIGKIVEKLGKNDLYKK